MNNYDWDRDFPKPPKAFHNKLCDTLAQLPDKEENRIMSKKITFKRTLLVAAVAVVALATTAFAVGQLYSTSTISSNIPTYETLPTVSQVKGLIKAEPKLVETFNNGYAFKSGHIGEATDTDKDGAVIRKFKNIDLVYTKDGARVSLYIQKTRPEDSDSIPNSVTYHHGDVDLQMVEYIMRTVPLDYVLTEQDKQDQAAGKISFGCDGSNEIKNSTVQNLIWSDGDVTYHLLTMDNKLPVEELLSMAKQIIDVK